MENKIFGNNLKDVMKVRRVTQKQLAAELFCSERCVQNYCYGRQPSDEKIIRICKILNVCKEDMIYKEHLADTLIIGHKLELEMEAEKPEMNMSYHSLEELIREIVREEIKEILKSINDQL